MSKEIQKGVTLVELVVMMIVVSILAAAAVTSYLDVTPRAIIAGKSASVDAVNTVFTSYLGAKEGGYPTVEGLASHVRNGTAVSGGVQVTLGNTISVVQTYKSLQGDGTCDLTKPTTSINDTVMCIGDPS